MGVLFAQEFQSVRRKIDEHQNSAGPQYPGRFGDRRGWPVGVMQNLMDHDRVEGPIGQRQLVHVVATDAPIYQPRLFEIDPRY